MTFDWRAALAVTVICIGIVDAVAACYQDHGIDVDVRTMTDRDRDNWTEWLGHQG